MPYFLPFLILIGFLFFNALVVFLYIIEYRRNKRILNQVNESLLTYRKIVDALMPNLEMLDRQHEAIQKAQEIINSASQDAQTILSSTKSLQQEVHDKVMQSFEAALKESKDLVVGHEKAFTEELQKQLLASNAEYGDMIKKVETDLENKADAQTKQFIEDIKNQVMDFGTKQRAYMEQELVKIEQELEQYKTEQMAKIEGYIYEILARTSESVLGQAVSLDTHQELIIKALEQAKREGVFA